MLRLECHFADKVRLHDHVFKQGERRLFVPHPEALPLGMLIEVEVHVGAGEVASVQGKVVGNRTKHGAGSHFDVGAWVQLTDDDTQALRGLLDLREGDGLRATARLFPRFRCTLPVQLEKPVNRTLQTANISEGGVCLGAHLDVPIGQIVMLNVDFAGDKVPVYGEVMWRRLEAGLTGIEFHYQNDATRERVYARVRRIAEQDPWQANARPLILVIDDEVATIKALERVLAVRGYGTVTAVSAAEALSMARAELPVLAVIEATDNGAVALELCHAIKNDAESSRIPVVLTSGAEQAELVRLLEASGSLAVLPKPFTFDALERLVWAVAEYAHVVHSTATEPLIQPPSRQTLADALVRCAYQSDSLHGEVYLRHITATGAFVVSSWGDKPGTLAKLVTLSHFGAPVALEARVVSRQDWGVLSGAPQVEMPGMQVELTGGSGLARLREHLR